MIKHFIEAFKENAYAYAYLCVLLTLFYTLLIYKVVTFTRIQGIDWFFIYSVLTFIVLIIKYGASMLHHSERWEAYKPQIWPEVDIIVPAYNEGAAIYETVKSLNAAHYPKDKMNIILVNDGSSDNTIEYIDKALAIYNELKLTKIDFKQNKGKKEAMAAGFRQSKSEFVLFIDSDSKTEKNCIKELVTPFYKTQKIGAVSGHANVWNADENLLTKTQEIRYFNAFRSAKAAESLLGFVSCCPGCCSAYRRTAIQAVLDPWLAQSFLGVKCTYGDDRSLTNLILKSGHDTVYNQKAIVWTIAPSTLKKYSKQQLRWKKSWARESIVVLSFAWRRSLIVSLLMVIDTITPFFAPVVIAHVLFVQARDNSYGFYTYLIGIIIFATCLGLFYKSYNLDRKKWLSGALYSSALSIVLFWQLPYALATLRDARWGTR